jgi:ActR/RegA family two-component response regulator
MHKAARAANRPGGAGHGAAVAAKTVLFAAPTAGLAQHFAQAPVAQAPPGGGLPPMPPLAGSGSVIGYVVMYGLALAYLEVRRWMADRRAATAEQIKELKADVERLTEENGDLRAQQEEHGEAIRANTTRNAGTEGKTDGALSLLVKSRVIKPADRSPGPHSEPAPTLVIVEDDAGTMHALAKLFTERGFAVREATTIADAIRWADKKPHWILLDLKLRDPGDGLEVLRHVRRNRIDSRVVVMTAAPDTGPVVAECRRLEPDALLFKPLVDERPLLAAVQSAAERPGREELARWATLAAEPEAPSDVPEED